MATAASIPHSAADGIERRSGLAYEEFVHRYLIPRKPVIVTGALNGWKAMSEWTPEFFRSRYGDREVRIAGATWKLGAYIDRVLASTPADPAPYLKDQIIRELDPALARDLQPFVDYVFPNWLRGRYPSGTITASLNRPAEVELFIGGAGTRLGELHYDYAHCHVALCLLSGRKQFTVFAPDQTPYLYAQGMLSQVKDIENPDLERFPLFAQARSLTFVQEPGEIVLLPTGWWHTTRLLTTCVAVAQNFANASNWRDVVDDVSAPVRARRPLAGAALHLYLRLLGLLKALGGPRLGRDTLFGPDTPR
jgi:histone arginine demethylase JMJD6